MLLYGLVLLASLVFCTFKNAIELRYVLLCFAPSYLLLIAKRIGPWEKDGRLGVFLGASYLVGLAGSLGYSLLVRGVF